MNSYAKFATLAGPEQLPLIRELLSYDVRCPHSCVLHWDVDRQWYVKYVLSPLHWSRQVEWPWAITEARFDDPGKFPCSPPWEALDVGSGWGVLKFAIRKRCWSVYCVDIDPESLEKSKESIRAVGFSEHHFFHHLGDARNLFMFKDESFDRVFCISVLEHLGDGWLDAVREMKRVLRPGGVLLLSFDVIVGGPAIPPESCIDLETAHKIVAEVGIAGEQMVEQDEPLVCIHSADDDRKMVVALVRWEKPA